MIKKRNLDPSLIQWIMTVTGLGPGIGEIFYVAPAASATSQYRTQWQSMGVEKDNKIYTKPSLAYAAMVKDRNDVMLVAPGLYTETASIDWTKDHTHMIGLGGPNMLGRRGRPNVQIHTDTVDVDYTVHLTGDFCQFHTTTISNGTSGGSADGDNLSAIGVAGYGNYFNHMAFRGINSAAQMAAAACSSVEIMGGSGELLFENCMIGSNGWGTARTNTTQGHLHFSYTSSPPSPQNGIFKDCTFFNRSVTAGVVIVYISNAVAVDRMWLFDNCHFENWHDANENTILTEVFKEVASVQNWHCRLRGCSSSGFSYWTQSTTGDNQFHFMADMPKTGTGGGLMSNCVGTTSN